MNEDYDILDVVEVDEDSEVEVVTDDYYNWGEDITFPLYLSKRAGGLISVIAYTDEALTTYIDIVDDVDLVDDGDAGSYIALPDLEPVPSYKMIIVTYTNDYEEEPEPIEDDPEFSTEIDPYMEDSEEDEYESDLLEDNADESVMGSAVDIDENDSVTEEYFNDGDPVIFPLPLSQRAKLILSGIGYISQQYDEEEEEYIDVAEDITENLELAQDGLDVYFNGSTDYIKINITFEKDQDYEYVEDESISNEENDGIIDFHEDDKRRLDFVYSILSKLDASQLESLSSDLENATIGSTDATEEDIYEIRSKLDSLALDEGAMTEETANLIFAIDTALKSPLDEVVDLTPANTEAIKRDFLVNLVDEDDPTNGITTEVLEALDLNLDETVIEYSFLTSTNQDEFIESFDDRVESLLTTEQLETANKIIIDHVPEPLDEVSARITLIRDAVYQVTGSLKKVQAANESIVYAANVLAETTGGFYTEDSMAEFLEDNEVSLATIESVIEAYRLATENLLPSTENLDLIVSEFESRVESLSELSQTTEISENIQNGGDLLESPVMISQAATLLVEVEGVIADEEDDTIYIDLTESSSIDTDGVTLIFDDTTGVDSLGITYESTLLESCKAIIRDDISLNEAIISYEDIRNAIVNDVNEYTASQTLDQETLEAVKLMFDRAIGDSLNLNSLNAKLGKFEELIANRLTVSQLTATKATIREATIDRLYVNTLFAQMAIINEAFIDNLEAGSIKAEAIKIKGPGGFYYQLNVNGETVEAEQTNENSLSGELITGRSIAAGKIEASSITADEINMDNLQTNFARIGPVEDYHLELEPDRISFKPGNSESEVAYMSTDTLFIENSDILSQQRIGNFVWKVTDNNTRISLRYSPKPVEA